MYNIHMATKIKKQLKKQRMSHLKQQNYLQTYSSQIQPKLLNNYNKRINTFLRKMQQSPIVLAQFDETQLAPHKLFRNLTQKEKFLGQQVFRFKDHNDWNSIYTEAERSQRKMNEKYMKDHFGDASLAYRSIASNSQYVSSQKHEYRLRQKPKQINPPMKYVCAVPKLMMKKLYTRNVTKMKTQGHDEQKKDKNAKQRQRHNTSSILQNKMNKSPHTIIDEDNRSVRSFKSMNSFAESAKSRHQSEGQSYEQNQEEQRQKQKKMYMSPKTHFKTLVEAFEKVDDQKVKESMREVLVKCKVFRIKDRKVEKMVEVDKLAMEIDNSNTGIGKNGMGK